MRIRFIFIFITVPFLCSAADLDENIDQDEIEENVLDEEENVNLNVDEENIEQPNSDSDTISDEDNNFAPDEPNDIAYHDNIYPGVEAKKIVVDYWVLPNNKRRKFSVVKNRHRQVRSVRQLRQWRKDLLERGMR